MIETLPTIGTQGCFQFNDNYRTVLKDVNHFTVTGVRSITDYLKRGEDIYKLAYSPYGITEESYNYDIQQDVKILTLNAGPHFQVYVPHTQVSSVPITSGVLYTNQALVVNIGALPKGVDITDVNKAIATVIKERLGITPEVSIVETSPPVYVPEDRHNYITTLRKNSKPVAKETWLVKYTKAVSELKRLRATITSLEQYILKCLPRCTNKSHPYDNVPKMFWNIQIHENEPRIQECPEQRFHHGMNQIYNNKTCLRIER